ncbi:MAG: M28 family peptidase [Bacteroidota bacterium]
MIRRMVVVMVFAAVTVMFAEKPLKKSADAGNVESITQDQLRDYLSFIASDELEGRDTPSRGLNIAAKFIATHLSRWGYTPAGDPGSFFQKITLNKTKVKPAQTSVEVGGQKFTFGSDFIASGIAANVSAPLVYVMNGYIHKAKNMNPYQGIDVKGKIMVVLGGMPKGITPADFGGKMGVDFDSPANYAKNNGALGIISIPSVQALNQWERTRTNAVEKGSLSVPAFKKADEKPAVPMITASAKLIDAIFAGEKTGIQSMNNRASADSVSSFDLSAGKKLSFTVAVSVDTLSTQNIVAVLEGSDKKLKDEYVAFGAHYDHIGIRSEPVNGDSISNGADDDGSGTVGLMAMAEAFSKGPKPKRSLLFVWHMGEEKGLWGSRYFVEHPTVPAANIITQLNIDMIGRSRPDTGEVSKNEDYSSANEVFSIGSNMMSSELGKLNEVSNASLYNLKLNYKFDDPSDPNRLFYRSDHYNYAKTGIPIVFFFDGIHEDYHRVTDEVSKIDFEKLMKVTKTVYGLGWRLSNLPKRPVVDKQFNRDMMD